MNDDSFTRSNISILDYIGEPAMLEMAAEECAELSHALLKLARIERKENPTPVTREEAFKNIREEWTDVFLCCARELGLCVDWNQIETKRKRFENRWKECHEDNGEA